MPGYQRKAVLVLNDPSGHRERAIDHFPFTIGRDSDQDLALSNLSVSRRHAQIDSEDSQLLLVDLGSRTGTFVNGRRIERHLLENNDFIRIGSSGQVEILFRSEDFKSDREVDLTTLIGQMTPQREEEITLGKLNWFVAAARRLNELGGIKEILSALIDTTLSLTGAERGYVFLRTSTGELALVTGRDFQRHVLEGEETISHSAIIQSVESGSEYIVTDTFSEAAGAPSQSVLAHSLRVVICIPLRKVTASDAEDTTDLLGVLYLDSRKERDKLTGIDKNLLHIVATDAAMLVQNINLVKAEEEGRRYKEELRFASEIQQGLMRVSLPELSFAKVEADSIPCKGIGGDFYDVISTAEGLYVVVADVSGKGLSAAILGSTLQGLIYPQLLAGLPLAQIALLANQFLCHKNLGKYATLVILLLRADGTIEYINCGHVRPLVHSGQEIFPLGNCNFPVGLVPLATFTSEHAVIRSGDRILIVTDGVSEPENSHGVAYGDQRLGELVAAGASVNAILEDVANFTSGAPLEDDCTLLEVCYRSAKE
jgi:serine phosphatase RsbU (regulator of sigma subunit)/pSer/pThr/pTyr-binding forkhead associated (FHA) protein